MLTVMLPVCVGVVVGWLGAGRLRGLGDLKWRAPALVMAGAGMQLVLGRVPPGTRIALVLVSYVMVAAWVALNVHARPRAMRAAFVLVGLGWAMNLAAMVPNGGMPVSGDALEAIGAGSTYDVRHGHLFKHVPAQPSTALPWLGDTIPVPSLRAVISLGDVVMATGITLLVSSAMVVAGPRRRTAPATSATSEPVGASLP